MKQFAYVIQDPLGIHARPAGALVKAAKPFADTAIQVIKGDKSVKATQLMKLMGLGVKTGDEITVTAEGPSEEAAIAAIHRSEPPSPSAMPSGCVAKPVENISGNTMRSVGPRCSIS